MRAWAYSEPSAHSAQERVDQRRIAALESVWSKITDDPERVRRAALLPYLVAVGASLVIPPIEPTELRGVYEILQDLIPPTDPRPPEPSLTS